MDYKYIKAGINLFFINSISKRLLKNVLMGKNGFNIKDLKFINVVVIEGFYINIILIAYLQLNAGRIIYDQLLSVNKYAFEALVKLGRLIAAI